MYISKFETDNDWDYYNFKFNVIDKFNNNELFTKKMNYFNDGSEYNFFCYLEKFIDDEIIDELVSFDRPTVTHIEMFDSYNKMIAETDVSCSSKGDKFYQIGMKDQFTDTLDYLKDSMFFNR